MSRYSVALIAALWFAIALATMIYEWGLNPVVFQAQDEAVVRFAAALIRDHGRPLLALPFADPEDMAHPRLWLSDGSGALPIYAPVTLYVGGLLLRLGKLGLVLVQALPAAAVAAFAAGIARLLPPRRRSLAVLAPLLGFASLYWGLRPWMNLSAVLACLCWAFLFWTSWVKSGKARWLAATTLAVGGAAAARPDYAGLLFVAALLLLLSASPDEWKRIVLWCGIAGVCAVVPNLILNKATTGHALRAVYQIALDRQYGADASHGLDGSHGFSVLSALNVLFAPMGIPTFPEFTREFKKYFINMGPTCVLVLAQLAIVPLWLEKSIIPRIALSLVVALALFFIVSRLHGDVFGGLERVGYVHHSAPRYLAPVFLFAVLPPILLLGRCRTAWAFYAGATLMFAVAADAGYELYLKQQCSFSYMRHWVHTNEALAESIAPEVPPDAIVYSAKLDKILWSRWRVGFFDDEVGPSARSMARGISAGLPVFLLEPKPTRQLRRLIGALKREQLALAKVDAPHGLYRLQPLTLAQSAQPEPGQSKSAQ